MMNKAARAEREGQMDLFLDRAPATMAGCRFRFRGRWYRIKGMPKRSPQRQIEVSFDRIDPRIVEVWDAAGEYLGTAIG